MLWVDLSKEDILFIMNHSTNVIHFTSSDFIFPCRSFIKTFKGDGLKTDPWWTFSFDNYSPFTGTLCSLSCYPFQIHSIWAALILYSTGGFFVFSNQNNSRTKSDSLEKSNYIYIIPIQLRLREWYNRSPLNHDWHGENKWGFTNWVHLHVHLMHISLF